MLCRLTFDVQVQHILIRVLGTRLAVAYVRDSRARNDDVDGLMKKELLSVTNPSPLKFLRSMCTGRSRVLRSLLFAVWYSLWSKICIALATFISSARIWLIFAEISTALLLESIHFNWTQIIVFRVPRGRWSLRYPWRQLFLPTVLHAIANKMVTDTPSMIGSKLLAQGTGSADEVASRDVGVFVLTIALRFVVLYPVWASWVYCEAVQASRLSTASSDLVNIKHHNLPNNDLTSILRHCYRRPLLRLVGLHLQAAGVLICIECGVYMVFIASLRA